MDYKYHKPVKEILDELSATNSRKEKERILQREKNNLVLKKTLYYALDPFEVFHIKQIPEYRKYEDGGQTLNHVLDRLHVLVERRKTGKKAQDFLAANLEGLAREDAEVLECVIKKDLRCGVQAKTVNKIWPGLVTEFNVMLAEKLTNGNIEYPAVVEPKLDGARALFIVKNGNLNIYTRNGKPMEKLVPYFRQYLNLKIMEGVVFDGELIAMENGKELPRQKGNGLLTKAQRDTIKDEDIDKLVVFFWDAIRYLDFKHGFSYTSFSMRRKELERCIKQNDVVRIVPQTEVETFYEAKKQFLRALDKGQEGIILKNYNAPWEAKRSKNMVKLKAEYHADLRVEDVIEGEGKYKGVLGSFLLRSEDGELEVNVGSGFSDEEREKYFTRDMIGEIVEVQYNTVIDSDDKEYKSLYLPIFKGVRKDKDVANKVEEL